MMTDTASRVATKTGWGVVGLLASAQFIMVLDTTVMNVSISQVVADLDTTVVGLQTAITLYTLVMASLMLIGGKFGERWGAKRTFAVGPARLRDRVLHHVRVTEPGRAAPRLVAASRAWERSW